MALIGCGSHAGSLDDPGTGPSGGEGPGQSVTDRPASEVSVRWLEGLTTEQVIKYEVRISENPAVTVSLRVARKIERGGSVAVQLVPVLPIPPGVEAVTRWLVGDEVGLVQVAGGDAQFVPLDEEGKLLAEARSMTTLRLPSAWHEAPDEEAEQGWAIDELELMLEGEVQGDRCARFSQQNEARSRMVIVCARVGIVEEVHSGPDGRPLLSWRLVGAQRADDFGD